MLLTRLLKAPLFSLTRTLPVFGLAGGITGGGEDAPAPDAAGEPAGSGPMASSFAMVLRGSSSVDDFDGDSRTDIAFAKPQGCVNGVYRYQIEVRFSIRPRATFEVQAGPIGGGLHIRSRDVDGDRDLDVVITTGVSGAPLGVWINDGHGRLTLGVAGGYPSSNWQDANETLGGPYSPLRLDLSGVLPGGGCSSGPGGLLVPPSGNPGMPLHATCEGHGSHPLTLGGPLRAPPAL